MAQLFWDGRTSFEWRPSVGLIRLLEFEVGHSPNGRDFTNDMRNTLPQIKMEPDRGPFKWKMAFQDPRPVRFHVNWWEGNAHRKHSQCKFPPMRQHALALLEEVERKQLRADVVLLNAAISACEKAGGPRWFLFWIKQSPTWSSGP